MTIESLQGPNGCVIGVEKVGPAEAADLLRRNPSNRKLKHSRITRYVDDMVNGRWAFTGDPIRIDIENNLIDGQNRCTAIVESGITAEVLVIRNLPTAARENMDIGAPRTVPDVLTMNGIQSSAVRAALARLLYAYDRGSYNLQAQQLSNPALVEYIRNRETGFGTEVGTKVNRERLKISGSAIGAAAQVAQDALPLQASTFFLDQVVGGLGLEPGSPALALRRRLTNMDARGRAESVETFWLALRAFSLYVQGEHVTKLYSPKTGWNAATVPDMEKLKTLVRGQA